MFFLVTICTNVAARMQIGLYQMKIFEESILEQSEVEYCESVLFRIVGKDNSEAFLCLYNIQNGYYGHGFDMKIGGQNIHLGTL